MSEEVSEAVKEPEVAQVVTEAVQPEEVVQEEKRVPLHELQKERRKRQELENQLEWERQQRMQMQQPVAPPQEDESLYEGATKGEVRKAEDAAAQKALALFRKEQQEKEETVWIRNNQDKAEELSDKLPEFLKQRPNLAEAIAKASNRYEEAWLLMDALTGRQKRQLAVAKPEKQAPNSPSSVPKAAGLTETVNVMSMTDAEFKEWRNSKKRR